MRTINKLAVTVSGLLFLVVGTATAQDEGNGAVDDQANVWATVEDQWNAEKDGYRKWIDRLLVDDFSGWGKNSPAPRSKSSTKMWDRFNDEQGSLVAHELYPLAIVVNGDVAIAHYLYSSAFQDKKDKVEMSNGRYTDILIRTDEGWKFISWHGGDDATD